MLSTYGTSHVEEVAIAAANAINKGEKVIVACLEPGNAGRYLIVLTRLTEGQARMTGNDWLLSLPEWRSCYPVSVHGYLAPSYVAEKVTGGNVADAEVVSAFLNGIAENLRD